ncbi:MAG: hypothetical protein JJV97_05555 [SAR324 cluster bacterium]|nr:hypothetical protein [SAR324 cluster bacterium]
MGRLVDYHHISSYVRELYQMDGIKETCDIERIKTNFYVNHKAINPRQIVPLGPIIDFNAPHDRDGIK